MATVLDIITRSLRRLREVGSGQDPDAADAAMALDVLNGMILGWQAQGVDAKYTALDLDDTFYFFVPPVDATSEVIDLLADQGTWNASTNSPTLASSSGTKGYFYRVSTAGSTDLDDVTSWAENDYAVFDGREWLKSIDPLRFQQVVVDLLAMELAPYFAKEPDAMLGRSAVNGWAQIQAAFIKPPTAIIDRAVMQTMQRAFVEEEITQ